MVSGTKGGTTVPAGGGSLVSVTGGASFPSVMGASGVEEGRVVAYTTMGTATRKRNTPMRATGSSEERPPPPFEGR